MTALLARKVNIGMTHAIVPSESVCSAERFDVDAQIAHALLFTRVVDRVLVPSKVVGSREDRVAGLPRTRVDPVAPLRAGLRVQQRRCHAGRVWPPRLVDGLSLLVALSLVLS